MKIYEFLGIDHLLMDIPIPQDAILENVDAGSYTEAVAAFRNIDYISLRVSLNRDEHYLQVMEIGMNTPRDIDVIARIIQKTIKYRILFIFTYQEHYLILWRNFKLTDSTEYVYSDGVAYCTDWIYDESLDMEVLWTCNTIKINNDRTRIVPLSFQKKNKNDDDGMAYFRDVVRNVYSVSGAIINRELVCSRYIVDWFACHAIGERVDLNYLLCEAIREEMYMIVDDHIFFEKDRIEVLCSEIENPNYMYKISMGRTGRVPWTYFDTIPFPATYDDEYDILSRLHEVLGSNGQYLVHLLNDHACAVTANMSTRYTAQRNHVAHADPPPKSDAQQKREAEYQAAVENETHQNLAKQKAEANRREAEENARRKAEKEKQLAEERRNAQAIETKVKISNQPEQEPDQLEKAKMYIGFANNSAYFDWLSAKVSGKFMDEIIKAYEIIQRFAITNRLLDAPLLETTDISQVRGIQDAVRTRKEFAKLEGNSRYFCGLAMRHYVQYISELEAKQPAANAQVEAHRKAEEERRKAEDARLQEEARRKAEEETRQKAEEERRLAEERRKAEEVRRQEEARRKAAEEETRRKAEEEARRQAEEEARKKAEHERAVEARRRVIEEHNREEARRRAEEQKQREEAQRKADEARRQEEARLREKEERRKAELLRQQAAEEKRAQYRKNNRCQHCGGEFKGFLGVFAKKCKVCQKPKDY